MEGFPKEANWWEVCSLLVYIALNYKFFVPTFVTKLGPSVSKSIKNFHQLIDSYTD